MYKVFTNEHNDLFDHANVPNTYWDFIYEVLFDRETESL